MITDINHILIFKTNILTEADKECIQKTLDTFDTIQQWTVDLQDTDRVLRIVSESLTPEQVISVIESIGFDCSELA